MRALFGLLASGTLGVAVSLITKPKTTEQLTGLVAGTQLDAMRQFKGGEPNRRQGSKARVHVKVDQALSGENIVVVSHRVLDEMAAEAGDLLYANHIRWWYGGLRSVHVKAGRPCEAGPEEAMRMSPEDAATAHFVEGQEVLLEKIM